MTQRTAPGRLGARTVDRVGSEAAIGVFDSGVGGLTVARALLDQLPHEAVRYLGDTAHGPYGPLPIAEVRRHSLAVMDELVDAGVKMLVIACNSASSAVLRDARERYTVRRGLPVVEVILPAAAEVRGDQCRAEIVSGLSDPFEAWTVLAPVLAPPRGETRP